MEPADPGSRAPDPHDLVGVYHDRSDAMTIADALREAGVDRGRIRVGNGGDEALARMSEMREEAEHAWITGTGPATKRMTKGMLATLPPAILVGALAGLVIGLIPWWGVALTTRLVIGVLVGAAGGATVGAIVGAGVAGEGPGGANAADRGITVRAPVAPGVQRVMERRPPIRLDEIRAVDGSLVRIITTEEDRREGGIVQDLRAKLDDPEQG